MKLFDSWCLFKCHIQTNDARQKLLSPSGFRDTCSRSDVGDLTGQLVRAPMKTGMRKPEMWPTVLDMPKMVPELLGAMLGRFVVPGPCSLCKQSCKQ